MVFLAGAATGALGKMTFVIAAHLRGDPRDVIAPACQNRAYDPIGTLIRQRRHSESPFKKIQLKHRASIWRSPRKLPIGRRFPCARCTNVPKKSSLPGQVPGVLLRPV